MNRCICPNAGDLAIIRAGGRVTLMGNPVLEIAFNCDVDVSKRARTYQVAASS